MLYCYYIPGTQFIIDDVLKQMFSMFVLTKRHYTITLLSHKLDTSNSLYKFWFVIMKKNAFNVWYVKLEKESYGHRNLEWKKKFLCKLRFDWLHLCKFSKKAEFCFCFVFRFEKFQVNFKERKKKSCNCYFHLFLTPFFLLNLEWKRYLHIGRNFQLFIEICSFCVWYKHVFFLIFKSKKKTWEKEITLRFQFDSIMKINVKKKWKNIYGIITLIKDFVLECCIKK